MAQPMRQDVGETYHDRRGQIAFLQALHDLEQIDLMCGGGIRSDHDVAGRIDREVT